MRRFLIIAAALALSACATTANREAGPFIMIQTAKGPLPLRVQTRNDELAPGGVNTTIRVGGTDDPLDALAAWFTFCRPGEGFARAAFADRFFARDEDTDEWLFTDTCPSQIPNRDFPINA